MKLRYFGQAEVYDIIIPDGSYLLPPGAIPGRRTRGRQARLVIPWRGGEIALAGPLVPLLATVGAFGLRIQTIVKSSVRSPVFDR